MTDQSQPVRELSIDDIVGTMAGLTFDPETAIAYFCAVSTHSETYGQTLSQDHNYTYEQNVALTAAALLDGFKRNQMLDSGESGSTFLNDVVEEMKLRNKDAQSPTFTQEDGD